MNPGTESGLTVSTFSLPSCLNRTSVQSMATRLPKFCAAKSPWLTETL
jgi:hypothetical protein